MEKAPPSLRGSRAQWRVARPTSLNLHHAALDCSPMLAHLLSRRGIETPEQIRLFLARAPISHDPFLIPSMAEAVTRIARAVDDHERVAIYGDFDCDGVTAAAVLLDTLRGVGLDPIVYIPARGAGHGLSPEGLAALSMQGVTLVVTADCGITAIDEVLVARGMGLDIIVTDHHEPRAGGTLPDCPVVAPTRYDSLYPWRYLCGAGVAYKLAQALAARIPTAADPRHMLDLVALGTVADVVPVLDENRSLVIEGLACLRHTTRPGLLALFEAAAVTQNSISPTVIAYYLAPRLNAANRMANPRMAFDLITATDPEVASQLAVHLNTLNRERQDLVAESVASLVGQLGSSEAIAEEIEHGQRPPVLIVQGDWPAGISGLLASKLVELYGLPAFVGSQSGDGVVAVSARGPADTRIDELLERCETALPGGIFLGFGGHARAGGFRVRTEDMDTAVALLHEHAAVDGKPVGPALEIDAELPLRRLTLNAASQIKWMEPFGAGFPEPLFLSRNATVRRIAPRGDGKHASMTLSDATDTVSAIWFNADRAFFEVRPGDRLDLVFHLQINEWRGTSKPELRIRDWRRSG